ncbi:aminopeptidase [Pelagivirga sediminicola]|uniref:Aminopeptidase n=1 Tax=Pelagivirga sediminicola TaxID=2170575 RepID=A0A2T7G604_9RHOB|nr:P1 family peptidase [Pelagivirga sediminicola]PVA09838.1 aminopeptidase [Pelagivirga sediminicola]
MRDTFNHPDWWRFPVGKTNTISDISGVRVGHADIRGEGICTGVTAVLPHDGDLFRQPVPAAVSVLNGFGKSVGLLQLAELGEIETPILLTNTFGVPACTTALIRRAIAANPEIGRSVGTVNSLVLECNDGKVNDIQVLRVTEADADRAIDNASSGFALGAVGAGSGMKTFGYAGGIGSASRRLTLDGGTAYGLGALVLSNFGAQSDLRVFGQLIPPATDGAGDEPDKGSIIILLATDAPLCSRQLERVARRSGAALGRLGSHIGHQSGDIALAFSTAGAHVRDSRDTHSATRICESRMDTFFAAAVEVVEEAILSALWHSVPSRGYDGSMLPCFRDAYSAFAGQLCEGVS